MKDKIIYVVWILLAAGALFAYWVPATVPVRLQKPLEDFPFVIDGWKGRDHAGSELVMTFLGADSGISREYEDAAGDRIQVYMSYFESMAGKWGPHQPQSCWIGKGWRFTHCAYETVPAGGVKYPAIVFEKIIARRGGEEVLLFTTYIINGRSEPRYRRFRLRLAYDSLVKRRAAVLAMQLSSSINGRDVKAVEDTIKEFLTKAIAVAEKSYFP